MTATIGVITGASSQTVQALLAELAEEWRAGLRITGVVEQGREAEGCGRVGSLRSITDSALYPIFQDLGAGSKACSLDGRGALLASAAIERDIEAGCDLVILSKFGKLEAGREGLMGAFIAAFDRGLPILTSVGPNYQDDWARFAGSHFVYLPAMRDALNDWRVKHVSRVAISA